MRKDYYLLALPALCIVALDQVTKYIVAGSIGFYESIPVIGGFFNLVHIRNRGMAFGLLNRSDIDYNFYFLVSATFVAIFLILFWFTRLSKQEKVMIPGLSLVLGGAIGNLIDRLRLREVIDFLDFHVGSYHWPSFNVADAAITVGTLWIVGIMLFKKTEEGS